MPTCRPFLASIKCFSMALAEADSSWGSCLTVDRGCCCCDNCCCCSRSCCCCCSSSGWMGVSLNRVSLVLSLLGVGGEKRLALEAEDEKPDSAEDAEEFPVSLSVKSSPQNNWSKGFPIVFSSVRCRRMQAPMVQSRTSPLGFSSIKAHSGAMLEKIALWRRNNEVPPLSSVTLPALSQSP